MTEIKAIGVSDLCFNRTFMELKYVTKYNMIVQHNSFNRTFMELKYRSGNITPSRALF